MPIKRKANPPGARRILHASLARRAHHARHIKALRGPAKVSSPVPVYGLGFKASSRPHPLRNVRLAGWNYLIVGGEAVGIAHLRVNRGTMSFAGITDGHAARVLLDAAILADRELQSLKSCFEARILDIPSLHIHALWLYSPRGGSRFVHLGAVEPSDTKLMSLSEIETRITAALAHSAGRARQTPIRRSMAP
jgi:hypothetical protein